MATLGDIHDWKNEISVFKTSDEGREYFKRFSTKPAPKAPIEFCLSLAEFFIAGPEIRDAFLEYLEWDNLLEKFPGMTPEHSEFAKKPIDAIETLNDFTAWYAVKSQVPGEVFSYFSSSAAVAKNVMQGKFSGARSKAAKDFVSNNFGHRFS